MRLPFEEKLRVLWVAVEDVHDAVVSSDDEAFRERDDALNPEPVPRAARKERLVLSVCVEDDDLALVGAHDQSDLIVDPVDPGVRGVVLAPGSVHVFLCDLSVGDLESVLCLLVVLKDSIARDHYGCRIKRIEGTLVEELVGSRRPHLLIGHVAQLIPLPENEQPVRFPTQRQQVLLVHRRERQTHVHMGSAVLGCETLALLLQNDVVNRNKSDLRVLCNGEVATRRRQGHRRDFLGSVDAWDDRLTPVVHVKENDVVPAGIHESALILEVDALGDISLNAEEIGEGDLRGRCE